MSMNNTSNDTATLIRWISKERLAKLIEVTGDLETAIEIHQDTLRLGSCLMTIVATIEISLRNAVCENLTAYFGVSNWLSQPPIALKWRDTETQKIKQAIDSAKKSEYAKLSQAEKSGLDAVAYPTGVRTNNSHLQRSKDRRQHLQISEGKIVAELTLYFWKRIYGPDYDQTLWRTTLKRTFPYKKLNRAEIATQLEHIYQTRNRLAHHEPVLHGRLSDVLEAINIIAAHLGESYPNINSPLSKLISSDLDSIGKLSDHLHSRLSSYKKL